MQFDINKLMKQAQKMQEQMDSIQGELGSIQVTGSAGGGAVVVTCDGRGEVQSIKIAKEATEDVETLEELVLAAVRDASKKASEVAQDKMAAVTQGMRLPGMPF